MTDDLTEGGVPAADAAAPGDTAPGAAVLGAAALSVAPPPLTGKERRLLFAAAAALQLIAWALVTTVLRRVVPLLWEARSLDVVHYAQTADWIHQGFWPYTQRVPFEYPPLSLVPMLLPPDTTTFAAYASEFKVAMVVLFLLAALTTTWAALKLWGTLGRPLAAAIAFAVAVLATGMIGLNRFDSSVALVVALIVLCLVCRRWVLAGLAVGLGMSLKLMPILLLPLVLVLARRWRPVWQATLAAAAGAIVPFLPFLANDAGGVWSNLVGGQTARGLQIETVAASPFLLRELVQAGSVQTVVPPGGSMSIVAAGAGAASTLAPLFVLALVAVVYLVIWKVRGALRADLEAVPVAVLAVMLAAMCGNKVLSPQHLIWVMPVVALALVSRRKAYRLPALLLLAAMVLTQAEYPNMYVSLQHLEAGAILTVVARNLLLLAAFVTALVALWRLPAAGAVDGATPVPESRP